MASAVNRLPSAISVASLILASIFFMIIKNEIKKAAWESCSLNFGNENSYQKKLPAALLATAVTVPALLPKVDAAELMPEVDMIQVEMLGTVNMQMAPIRKTIITVPKERIPLPANQAICSRLAAVPF